MNVCQSLNRLYLNDYLSIHNQVHSITAVQLNSLIDNRQRNLPFEGNTPNLQFMGQAFFIGRFQ